ncbi:heat shock protein DnaJ Pfj2 [Cryptosporidium ryanae]|uniref:heat shock protein DnaJ Pfj2 n=1 Tax=Cryptosporidium ryanae TaxID=515981 RepID=UPI00351A0222|nr:heat shock protein DnaJ Pfj2 [Cryptosporidium ryanae]
MFKLSNKIGFIYLNYLLLISSITILFILPVIAGKDYYKILGIPRNASDAQIKKAYRKLSLKYHPDKNPTEKEKFMEVANAYETLINPETRRKYDRFGEEGLKSDGGFGDSGFGNFGGFGGFGGFGDFGSFGDFGGFRFSSNGNTFHFGGFGGNTGFKQGNRHNTHFESQGSSINNLYTDSKHVTELSTMSVADIKDKIKSREWIMVINFYRPGCGPCKQTVQNYNGVAKIMSQYDIKFAALNCDTHYKLCQSYNVERYPHIAMFIKGKNSSIVYNTKGISNPYSESNLGKWVTDKIPDYSIRLVSAQQTNQWLKLGKHIPKAVLFTNKYSSSLLLKKIAKDFQNRLNLAIVSANDYWLKDIFYSNPHMENSKPNNPPYILSIEEINESNSFITVSSGEWFQINTISNDVITLTLSRIVGSFRAKKQQNIIETKKSKVRELTHSIYNSEGYCNESDSRFCVVWVVQKNNFLLDKNYENLSFKYRNDPINFFWISAFKNGKNSDFIKTFNCNEIKEHCIVIYRAKRRKYQVFKDFSTISEFIDGLLDGSRSLSSNIPRNIEIPVPSIEESDSEENADAEYDEHENDEYSDSEEYEYYQSHHNTDYYKDEL